ncbi:MAG: glycosyltransferase [bacterium]|nr:glycosyltransferase [bacterium]
MFSVLMSVYYKEKPNYLDLAFKSLYDQTVKDFQIVLICDGPLTKKLDDRIKVWKSISKKKLLVVRLKENKGLGIALQEGLKHCKYDIIARMDADDYCDPTRLEKQYNFLKHNLSIDVVSCTLKEFVKTPDNVISLKPAYRTHQEIEKKFWFRSPINHPAAMFRKKAVLEVGGYKDLLFLEDYYLWARIWVNGGKFWNLSEPLYYQRINQNLYRRRGGIIQLKNEIFIRHYLYKNHKIRFLQFLTTIVIQVFLRLVPSKVRRLLWSIVRKKYKVPKV